MRGTSNSSRNITRYFDREKQRIGESLTNLVSEICELIKPVKFCQKISKRLATIRQYLDHIWQTLTTTGKHQYILLKPSWKRSPRLNLLRKDCDFANKWVLNAAQVRISEVETDFLKKQAKKTKKLQRSKRKSSEILPALAKVRKSWRSKKVLQNE